MSEKPLFEVIWERKRVVFGVTGLVLAAGIVYTLVVPPVWEAKATVMFPIRNSSLSMLGGLMEGAGLSTSLMGGPTPLKVFGGVLKSERALELVAKEANLSRRDLIDMRDITDQANENSLTVAARNTDPEFAKRVVALHIDALAKINGELNTPLFQDDTSVLEDRIQQQKVQIQKTEAELLQFQKSALTAPNVAPAGSGKDATMVGAPGRWGEQQRALEIELGRVNGMLRSAQNTARWAARSRGKLPSQLPPVVKWRDRLTELEYELQMRLLTLAPEAPEIAKLKESIGITRRQMESEVGQYMKALNVNSTGAQDAVSIPELIAQKVGLEAQVRATGKLAQMAPAESIQLTRLMRDLASRTAILQQLQGQYEIAKVQESRNPNKWEVLDHPWVDDRPVNKGLLRASAASIFLGLFLGSCIAAIGASRQAKKAADAAQDDYRMAA